METAWKSKMRQLPVKTPALPPPVIDAFVQTDSILSKDEFCQTEHPEKTDFQIQVDMEPEEKMPNLIKDEPMEIEIPNIASQMLATSTGTSSDDDSTDDLRLQEPGDGPSNDSRTDSQNAPGDKNDDDSILRNSEVYKIYCEHKDPEKAMENIIKLINCLSLKVPNGHGPGSPGCSDHQGLVTPGHLQSNDQNFETAVETIRKFFEPTAFPDLSNLKKLNFFVDGHTDGMFRKAFESISKCTTTIKMIHANGFEFWIVTDFEKGPAISKWYRGHAINPKAAENLARLNLAGIRLPQMDHSKNRHVEWFHVAEKLAYDLGMDMKIGDFEFSGKNVEISATLSLTVNVTEANDIKRSSYRKRRGSHHTILLKYISLKLFQTSGKPPLRDYENGEKMTNNLKERMKDEARNKAYGSLFFRYGLRPGDNKFIVDQLHRFVKTTDNESMVNLCKIFFR